MWMPIIRRDLLEPLYGWISRSPRLRYWKELEKTQFLSQDRLLEIQWLRLRELLRYVWDHNAFYLKRFREAGLTPESIRSPEEFRRLPILTKSEIRSSTREMISRGYDIERLQKAKTGGSTGKALELFFTEECSEMRNACALRHNLWSGWRRGEPVAAIWGNPVFPHTLRQRLLQYISQPPTIYLDTMAVSVSRVTRFVEQWRKVKPTLIFGHAHSIFVLAQLLQQMEIQDLRPNGIISSSMMLLPHERRKIEEVFGTKVTDRYGCEEVGLIASECERHEGMHLNIEHLLIEFLRDDGASAAPGEPGRIVVTDLLNSAMPLIRYQVEDVGVPGRGTCSCGRGLPLMDRVVGRTADFLIRRDGTRIAGVSLIENTLTKLDGIDQMQIVQEDLEHIVLNLVPGSLYDEGHERTLREYFTQLFLNEAQVEVRVLTQIAPEPSGKYRFSICKLKA